MIPSHKTKAISLLITNIQPVFDFNGIINAYKKILRRVSTKAIAGQYMCSECSKIFQTKRKVDEHRRIKHSTNLTSIHDAFNGLCKE